MNKKNTLLSKYISFALISLVCFAADGQNLVTNPSFENTSSCPTGISEFNLCSNWLSPNIGADSCSSPDLYAACSSAIGGVNVPNCLLGYHQARTGNHFGGIILGDGFPGCTVLNDNYREYIEAQLTTPMVAGQNYLLQFYVSLASASMWGSNSFGVYLSNTQYTYNACTSSALIPVIPQLEMCGPAIMDTVNWVPIQWIYTAVGGEQYFTIGNFLNDANTNRVPHNCGSFNPYIYYYIDDVYVGLVPPNNCGVTLVTDSVNASCGASNGSASVVATGCTSPFTYAWSSPGGTGTSIQNLAPGTYTVSVTNATNCTETVAITVNQRCATSVCRNTNGSVTVSGGTAPYTWYAWDSVGQSCQGGILFSGICLGGTLVDSFSWTPYTTGATITPRSPGDSLIVVDNTGTADTIYNISALPVCTGCNLAIESVSSIPPGCGLNNGSATVNVTPGSGTPPYHYRWSSGAADTLATVNGLSPGTYTVTVTDAGGCSVTASVVLNAQSGITLNQTTSPAYCGNSNGKVYIAVSGGTPAYTYSWSGGISTTDSAVNLAPNTYTVTVTDANHCSATVSATVPTASGATISLVSEKDVTCNGIANGKIYVTASGGAGPYRYTWSPSVSTTDSAVGLTQGTYFVTVHDANNCTSSLSVIVNQPGTISVSTTTTQATCGGSDGSATATVNGGVGSPSFQWSAGGSTTSATDNGLPAGSYTVTVTDGNGCSVIGVAGVSNIGAPSVSISSQTNVNCSGGSTGSIILGVSGGTLPYSYTWSTNTTTTIDSAAINLTAGIYTVTVHDASSCIAVVATIVTQPQPLSAGVQSTNADCLLNNGSADIAVSGGTSPYTYTWSVAQSNSSITGLQGGTYYVTVTDGLGCQFFDSVVVGTTQPQLGILQLPDSSYVCAGDSVILDATTTNATSYLWSGTGFSAAAPIITATSQGVYYVTASNICGSATDSTIVAFIGCSCRLVMPNAFTPNGDGSNDYFYPRIDCVNPTSLTMRIYSRWGQRVFETNDLFGQWDGTYKGTLQPSGVYLYYVEFDGLDNNVNRSYKLTGSLTLTR